MHKDFIMTNKELSITLREEARFLGLCDEWYGKWVDDCSKDELINKMYAGIDFVIEHHWPSNDVIKARFDINTLRRRNVFVDDKRSFVNARESLILGKSDITARYNAWQHGVIYVRDDSTLNLTAKNYSFVLVHVYERAVVNAVQEGKARIAIVKHSSDTTITTSGDVRLRDE